MYEIDIMYELEKVKGAGRGKLSVYNITLQDLKSLPVYIKIALHQRDNVEFENEIDLFSACKNTGEISEMIKLITLWELRGEYSYKDISIAEERLNYLVISEKKSDWDMLIERFMNKTLINHLLETQEIITNNPELKHILLRG